MRGRGKGTGGEGARWGAAWSWGWKRAPGCWRCPTRARWASLTVCLHHHLSGWVPGWRKRPCLLEHRLWVSFCLSPPASDSLSFFRSLHASLHLRLSVPLFPGLLPPHCSLLFFHSLPPITSSRSLQPSALPSLWLQTCCLFSPRPLRFGVGWGNQEGGLKSDFLATKK